MSNRYLIAVPVYNEAKHVRDVLAASAATAPTFWS